MSDFSCQRHFSVSLLERRLLRFANPANPPENPNVPKFDLEQSNNKFAVDPNTLEWQAANDRTLEAGNQRVGRAERVSVDLNKILQNTTIRLDRNGQYYNPILKQIWNRNTPVVTTRVAGSELVWKKVPGVGQQGYEALHQAHFLYWGQLNAFIGEMQQAEHRNPTRQELLQEQAKLVADLNAQLAQVNVRVIPLNDGSLNLDWSPVKAGVGKGGGLGGHGDIGLPPDGGPNGVGKKPGRGRKEPEPGPGGPGGPEPDRPGEPGPDRPNPGKQEPPGKDNGEGKEEKQEGLIEGIIDIAKQIVKKLRKGSPPQEVQAAETELREFITDTTRLDGPDTQKLLAILNEDIAKKGFVVEKMGETIFINPAKEDQEKAKRNLEYAKGSLKKLEESVIQGRGIDQGAVKELDALLPELRATQIAELSLDRPKEIEDKNNNVTYKISTDVDEDNVISLRVEQVKPDAEIQQEAADKAKKVQELCTAESPVVPEIRAAIKEFNRTLRALSPEARAEPLKTLPFADPGRTYVNGAKDFYVKITIQDEHVQLEDLAESDKNHEKDTQKNYQDAVDAVRTKPFAFVEGKIKSANAELAQMTPEGRTGAVKRILRESTYDIVGSAYHVQFKREADRITVANLFKPEEKPDNNDKEKKLPPAKDAPVGERRELKNGFIVEKKTGEIWYRVGGRKPDLDENFPRSYTDKMVDTAGAKILSRESANIPEIRTIKEKYVDNLTIQKAMQELVGDNYWVVKVSAMEVNGKPTVRCELNSMVAMSTGPGRIATERLTLDREIDLKNPPTPEDLTREFTFRFIASRDRDGHSSEADGRLKDMIKKEPKDPAWKNELAWKYAIRKDSTAEEKQTAEKLAKEACLLEPNNYEYMDTLAAALAANGKFGDAMGVQAQAIEAAGANNPKLAEFQARLKLYKQEKPYVEGINSSNKPNQPNAPQNGQEQNTEELSMREKQERWTRSMENIHETLRRDPTLKVIQPSDTALTVSRGGVSIQFSRDGFAAGNVSSIYTRVDRFYDGKPEQMNSISLAKWNVENVKDFLEVELPDANNNQIKQYSENIHGTDITGTPEATLFFKYEVLKARDNRIFDRVTGKSVWKMEPGETIDLKTDNQGRVTMRAYDKEEKKYFNFTFERDGSVLQHGPEEGSVSPDRSSTQQDLMRQLSAVPANILSNYTLSMQSNGTLVINPRERDPGISTRSVQAQRNAVGGLNLTLSGGSQFNSFVWKTATLNTVLTEKQKEQYGKGNSKTRWDLQLERNVLQWTGTNGDSGIFVFSKDARVPALLSVCSEGASQMDMVPGQGMISVRKPVIYLYPTKEMSVDVSVQLKDMDFVAQYPKMQNGKWSVTALPSGDLVETASGKKFSYLFWEANSSKPWTIDEQSAFCVAGSDAADFLEDSLTRLGLNAKERNDFIVYWLPMLQANPFSLVQFLATEYTNKTPLSISPKPDTIIRVFMVFKAVDRNLETHPVKIRPVERRGFTVVEWGGTNLDEHGGRTA